MKKLIPALALLVVSAVLMGTSTFAWFSLNNKVTVTGMTVTTHISNSLLIAEDTLGSTTKKGDANFKTSYVANISALLEPVSTINGKDFWYNSTKNVTGTGDAVAETYLDYDEYGLAGTPTNNFNVNYGETTAVGYVDYVFQLKATNTHTSNTAYVNLTAANLVYGGDQIADSDTLSEHAFRLAVFAEDVTAGAATGDAATLKSILAPTGADNFTDGEAVNSATTTAAVTYNTAANLGSVDAKSTQYFKVVVRLWIEGEDETCKNDTFAKLTDAWALNLTIQLDDSTGGATVLTTTDTATKIGVNTDTVSNNVANAKVVDGVTYYQLGTNTDYYTPAAALSNASKIYSMVDGHPIEVTNACTMPAGKFDLTSDTVSATEATIDAETCYQMTTNTTFFVNNDELASATKVYRKLSDNTYVEVTDYCKVA